MQIPFLYLVVSVKFLLFKQRQRIILPTIQRWGFFV